MKKLSLFVLLAVMQVAAWAQYVGMTFKSNDVTYKFATVTTWTTGGGFATLYVGDGTNAAVSTSTSGVVVIQPVIQYGMYTCTVVGISDYAFKDCTNITQVYAGGSIGIVGRYAFQNCSKLTTLTGIIGNWEEGTFYGCSSLTSVVLPNGMTKIPAYLCYGCSSLTSVTIPSSVTSIGERAFSHCSGLTSITIPNSVTSIGGGAFSDCSGLTSITIPNSVTSIREGAFYHCSGLTSVTIPNSVTSIGKGAFEGCRGLSSISVDVGNTIYDSRNNCNAIIQTSSNTLVKGCNNTVIPSSVTSIGNNAFDGCSGLTSVTIPKGVTSIGNNAFYGCSGLTSITIPNSVTSIGECAFQGCSGLTSITIPNSVTSIGKYAFYFCSGLTSVTIPSSVTSIGYEAFYECSGLTSLTIGSGVTSIGGFAFAHLTKLTSVKAYMTTPFTSDDAFWNIGGTCCLYVPVGTKADYIDKGWTEKVFQGGIYEMADVNGDNEMNISDVTTLVNMVLGKTPKTAAADLNGDNDVNISDVTALVNLILKKK